jgi:hypothetical protein
LVGSNDGRLENTMSDATNNPDWRESEILRRAEQRRQRQGLIGKPGPNIAICHFPTLEEIEEEKRNNTPVEITADEATAQLKAWQEERATLAIIAASESFRVDFKGIVRLMNARGLLVLWKGADSRLRISLERASFERDNPEANPTYSSGADHKPFLSWLKISYPDGSACFLRKSDSKTNE